jgi:cell division protein FtsZ
MSLLQRLASVGLGRRDEPAEAPAEPPRQPVRQAAPPPPPLPRAVERAPERPQLPPAPRPQEVRMPEQVAEYARRPAPPRAAPQGLDPHGRVAPSAIEDDELEIPAFLRRQAN